MRWLYHLRIATTASTWPYASTSLSTEGFVHASYRDAVRESATLYFPKGAALEVLMIDPRKLTAPVAVATTPRGPMPHIEGPIAESAVLRILSFASFDPSVLPDQIATD